ncbi:hypothetical protein E8E13_011663 [Curvularia kusanoi]|uniref:Uncharacterized protein n=1 Tax=Curvularia kusanoi TaxID=90978 RepID=A0A9P4WF27_CURKU|nr:hypothetical protein E8E13_011663 [Curvularia kusanoi]
MPYNPTRILHNGDHIYVFRPLSQSSTQFQLDSINVSTKLSAGSLPYTTLSPSLPFLDDQIARAFTPVLDDDSNLSVYTGNCTQGATGAEVWSFTPASGDDSGTWHQENMTIASSGQASTTGANYLSSGVSFSSIVGGDAANTGAYIFGGMCPFEENGSSNWQSAANYSNLMVTLTPSNNADSAITYEMDVSSSRGPPIPEAGFTMTGLSPTYSNRSDGSQTQQQNFVLIGGHTSAAFINMSQVALFSLPEQGWTFIGIQPPDTPHTIDPRSGHTAVLSSDGQQIVVYGGWVGDIDTPAEPQLAVLNIADGYGGEGKWKWVIPSNSLGNGPSSSSSLYGHGAVMLPGSVMMVTGGYPIDLSFAAHRYNGEDYSPGFDGRGGHADAMDYYADQDGSYYFPPGTQGGQGWKSAHGQDAERTGLLLEIPSPTRGLRRSLSGRPAYAMGVARGPGQIHPIDELEEEDENERLTDKTHLAKRFEDSERKDGRGPSVFDNPPQFDPFNETYSESSKKVLSDSKTQTSGSVRSNGHTNIESSRTAHSFAQLQAEGETLLGGNPEQPYTDSPGSPVEPSAANHRRSFPSNQPPRRAASDATFWKSRRGQHDWEEEAESRWARNSGDDWGAPEDIARAEKDRLRQEWRERGNLLVNLTSDDELPTPRTPIAPNELGIPSVDQRPSTPADEGDWDVEAAVERRVVQVMFTVPKSKLRVVNADPDGSSILSLPREDSIEGDAFLNGEASGSPSRVKNLAGKFEQMSASKTASSRMTPRASPVPSPSASVKSMKVRSRLSPASLNKQSNLTKTAADLKANDGIVEE